MATISYTIAETTQFHDYCQFVTWTPMTNSGSDVGSPYERPGWADRCVQVFGTFGTGGTVVIEGSNDGTNYATLADAQGNALSITTAKIEEITCVTRYIRPRITGGDGTTSLTVILSARKAVR